MKKTHATVSLPGLGSAVAHSLFPLSALVIIGGALVWGPWVSLILAYAWWKVVSVIG